MKDISDRPGARAGGPVEWAGVTYDVILPAAASGGAVSVVDSESPAGSGPPRHVHDREDETFVVLTGAIEWWLEGETGIARAGEALFVPRGREHTFRATADGPCRHLVILTPGGFEGFFLEMAAGACRIPEDMEAVTESAARHSLRFTGPPLGAEAG